MKRWLWLCLLLLAALAPCAFADVTIYLAYAENERPPLFFPDPWQGSPNTIFLGYGGPDHDAGAILIRNTGSTDVVLGPGAVVDGFANRARFQLWDDLIGNGITIHPGQNLILTETASRNFDTSDQPIITDPKKRTTNRPVIHLTLNGVARTFKDTAQVLNTGGFDVGEAYGRNESLQWRRIGTTGIANPEGTSFLPINVLTHHYDIARTGQNVKETTLAPANVTPDTFGKLFSYPVDGYVYASPLLLTNVLVPNRGLKNVVYVATEHNSVYAFNADSYDPLPLWQVNLAPPITSDTVGCGDLVPEIGITATPVIDTKTGTLYVITKSDENNQAFLKLHALDVKTGAEKFGGPVVIQGSVPGNGDGTDGNGHIPFDPLRQNTRPALLLSNGILYIASASHCDIDYYHGWVFAYDPKTLRQVGIFNTSPNGNRSGIWQSGAGLAADSKGYIYGMTGNGSFNAAQGGTEYGDSFLKLKFDAKTGLSVKDYFTPYNQQDISDRDADLCSGGPLLLPDSVGNTAHPHLMVGAGKDGTIYLVDRDKLGKFNPTDNSQIAQSLVGAVGGTWSMPAYFKGRIYYQGVYDILKAFSIANGQLDSAPVSQTGTGFDYPGATPTISASGDNKGIAWVLEQYGGSAVLHAYNADDLSQELYNSAQMPGRDDLGGYVKFTTPVVANDKVYVPTQYGLSVYGNGVWTQTPNITPGDTESTTPITVTITDGTPGAAIYYTTDGSLPTKSSTLYTAPFTVTNSTLVKARAFAANYRDSGITQAGYLIDNGPGNGDGLQGYYYQDSPDQFGNYSHLSGNYVATRLDSTINFIWNEASPIPGVNGDNWSARWVGQVLPRVTGPYTFSTVTDDGVRLWVNGQLLIDDWTYHAPTVDSGTITLTAGQKVSIEMDFFQGYGGSMAQLYWANWIQQTPQIIPQSQLYSGITAAPAFLPNGGTFSGSVQVTITDATPGATIYYTTNGTTPTKNSTRYTGPISVTATTTIKAFALHDGYSDSAVVSATYTLNTNKPLFQINAGGDAATPYQADAYFNFGNTYAVSDAIDTSAVTNPAPQAVYQSERWGAGSYTFSVTPRRNYLVRLHFAEIYWQSFGQRLFNVSINGTKVLSNFDIVAAAGSNLRAIVREFTTTGQTGKITVQFDAVVDNPKVSGIEIIPLTTEK